MKPQSCVNQEYKILRSFVSYECTKNYLILDSPLILLTKYFFNRDFLDTINI